jgi:hypothetical protein
MPDVATVSARALIGLRGLQVLGGVRHEPPGQQVQAPIAGFIRVRVRAKGLAFRSLIIFCGHAGVAMLVLSRTGRRSRTS